MSRVELFPAYRSDVLIQAPETAGTYLLTSDELSPQKSLRKRARSIEYLMKVEVAGPRMHMPLPKPDDVAKCRARRPKPSPIPLRRRNASGSAVDSGGAQSQFTRAAARRLTFAATATDALNLNLHGTRDPVACRSRPGVSAAKTRSSRSGSASGTCCQTDCRLAGSIRRNGIQKPRKPPTEIISSVSAGLSKTCVRKYVKLSSALNGR